MKINLLKIINEKSSDIIILICFIGMMIDIFIHSILGGVIFLVVIFTCILLFIMSNNVSDKRKKSFEDFKKENRKILKEMDSIIK